MKTKKCNKWFDSIAKYKRKEYQGKCETCLYLDHCEEARKDNNPCEEEVTP